MSFLTRLLQRMSSHASSDLFLATGHKPALRTYGTIELTSNSVLPHGHTEKITRQILNEEQWDILQRTREINVGIKIANVGRFRVNVFFQRNDISLVFRSIPPDIPAFETLGLPQTLLSVVMQKTGLILVVGPTSSGKSTTLASLIDHRIKQTRNHVITLEDPIEYAFDQEESVVNQREVGSDTLSYHDGLVNALRQSPDVLMVGEIRHSDIMEEVIDFADTGHLCLATMHANSVTQAIERVIHMFPGETRHTLCSRLAQNLRCVISQRLLPSLDSKVVVGVELMVCSPAIRDLISRGEFSGIKRIMEGDMNDGMQCMDEALYNLYKEQKISQDVALQFAESENNLRLKMRLENRK